MASAPVTAIKILALIAYAGVACTFPTGPAAGAATSLASDLAKGVGGNAVHEFFNAICDFFGTKVTPAPGRPHNHDIDTLAARAIKAELAYIAKNPAVDTTLHAFCESMAKADEATLAALLQRADLQHVNEAAITSTLGSPMGGKAAKVADVAYWTRFIQALDEKLRQGTATPGLIKQVGQAIIDDLVRDDSTSPTDPRATQATNYIAERLTAHVATRANEILRSSLGPQGRFFIAALFKYLHTILAAVNDLKPTDQQKQAQQEQFKRWMNEAVQTALAERDKLPPATTESDQQGAKLVDSLVSDFAVALGQMGAEFAFIREHLSRQADAHAPNLTLPVKSTDLTRDRFVYKTERITLVGREQELLELNTWLDKPDPFGWDLWVGPAGSGKSRLALHLCKDRANPTRPGGSWYAGFYQHGVTDLNNWRQWTPRQHTLIVLDYVAEKAELIGQIIDLLTQRAVPAKDRPLPQGMQPWPQGIRVRCLLLERAALKEPDAADEPAPAKTDASPTATKLEAPWLATLRAAAKQSGAAVESVYARGDIKSEGRYIGGVRWRAARKIVEEEAAFAGESSTRTRLARRLLAVRRIDKHLRPLFVAMDAEAHRANKDIADFAQLVQYIQEKEWEHALERLHAFASRPNIPDQAWEKLVCLATTCEGLTDDPTGSKPDRLAAALELATLQLPTTADYGDGSSYALLVSGANSIDAPKLEPDIVGEAMVLAWLSRHAPRDRKPLITAAWQLGMDGFVARCAQNFPTQVEASGLLAPQPGARPSALAAAHTALALREYDTGGMAAIASRGQRLLQDPAQPPAVRALGAFLWQHVVVAGEAAAAWLAYCDDLLANHAGDPVVRGDLADGLCNAHHRAPANTDAARDLLARLEGLHQAHNDDAVVRGDLAEGLYTAFRRASADPDAARDLLTRLEGLYQAHKDDAVVRRYLAKGLYTAHHRAPANTDAARDLLARLEGLYQAHKDDAVVRRYLANGLDTAHHRASADPDAARDLLARLEGLHQAHKDDAVVRGNLAEGLYTAFRRASADPDAARDLLTRLEGLYQAHKDDAVVRRYLAKGLFNAFHDAPANTDAARELLARLQALADRHADHSAVNIRAWIACRVAFVKSAEAGGPNPAPLISMAALLPRLAGDRKVQQATSALIDVVSQRVADTPQPLKSELDAALGVLQQAYRATFGKPGMGRPAA